MRAEHPAVLRRLEITLYALLGRPMTVQLGPELASDGETVWLPAEPLPFRAHLPRALQASTVASGPITGRGGGELSGWQEVLANLYAEEQLRKRFPGLAGAYDVLGQRSVDKTGALPSATSAGDTFLHLVLSQGSPVFRPSRRLRTAFESWRREWEAWRRRPKTRLPIPPVTAPTWRLPYQAARRPVATAEAEAMPGYRGAPPGTGRLQTVVLGATPDGRRIVLPLPNLHGAGLPAEGAAGALVAGGTTPAAEEPEPEPAKPSAWYDEWDAEHGGYRAHWCAVFDRPIAAGTEVYNPGDAIASAAVRRIRRAFEHYRVANRWNRRESEGAELDMEAAVEARAEGGQNRFATDRIFMSKQVRQPEAAVVVLIDLSDSVSGMTLQIEKQALLLLGAALAGVGDVFAFYGFHGRSRLGCQLRRIKDFGEPYNAAVSERVKALQPAGWTRIAPALRHVTARLASTSQRHKILLLVTDGMPHDVEGYGGMYAVEDTRRAWLEARAQGVRPYCLNIDFTANQDLPHMCGPASWTVVAEARRLPNALLALYQRVRT